MTRTARILLVDDEVSIQRAVAPSLQSRGYEVEIAGTGREALRIVSERRPELIVLDLGLPDLEGTEVCRRIRSESAVPIIVLSARSGEGDKVSALDLGADDYVTKPFALDELLARVNAVLRRSHPQIASIALGALVVDFRTSRVLKNGTEYDLRPREIDILRCLAERQGKVVTREELLRTVWGYDTVPLTRTVDIAIARLRRKIEPDPHHPRYLRTAHRDGYSLTLS